MLQPPAVAFTAFADAWPRAIEAETGAALCAMGAGKDFDFFLIKLLTCLLRNDLMSTVIFKRPQCSISRIKKLGRSIKKLETSF